MLLHYKPMGSQDVQQLRMEAADDKKVASLWLSGMHKVKISSTPKTVHAVQIGNSCPAHLKCLKMVGEE